MIHVHEASWCSKCLYDNFQKLVEAVKRFGSNWWKIQEFVSTRSAQQCRERYVDSIVINNVVKMKNI
jgi:Myb-like DNA-binding domain